MATTTQDQIRQAAIQAGVDPAVALAVAQSESGFKQSARGTSGEVGIFQLMPNTARGLSVDPYNQEQNVQGGVSYLAQLYAQFGNWVDALAHYNGGNNPPASSYQYAQNVLSTATLYGAPAPSPDVQEASVMPNASEISGWAWWAIGGVAALALLIHRD